MPTISKGSKVLVSGANGYIAMWVARILLERGYSVRGTVRSVDKGKFLSDYFVSLGYSDQFETVVVEEIVKAGLSPLSLPLSHIFLQEGAFDEAVKGVDAIAHMASPFHTNVKEPDGMVSIMAVAVRLTSSLIPDFLIPAVQGTMGMLKSALNHGSVSSAQHIIGLLILIF